MSPEFRHLFTPLRIGGATVRNRLYMSAATLMFSTDNLVSNRHVAFYSERAKGGIGLIVTEEIEVHPTAAGLPLRWLVGWKQEVVEPYRRLTSAVHRDGATIFAQLDHAGTIHDPAVSMIHKRPGRPRPSVTRGERRREPWMPTTSKT